MNKKAKQVLFYIGLFLDVAITVFLLVVAIIMLATMPSKENMSVAIALNGPFIGYLQQNPNVYLLTCVIPLVALLILNIVILIVYVKKAGKKKTELSDLTDEQKAALKAELLKDVESDKKK